ncbi:UDP-2,4-diacetamido-2,4,6-trideoxy-beta-L-altropyranose hydrolase [Aliiglaciecola sp. CAU 1673]|uniref:UDP-2,4-diacetamido-2,4, 6-trideoxy-beta-L-altropyranose hydrolase n=1 Tax=Aliiglaciecola sp. CAU 1673 TaxID=3032595 RepID=UPI0023DBCEC8|nr:UDP-2,4-diacetamido-2,4,6-trideoxy-beta-L-altropyranose hydrolase [Aliiglaciecola sp. CAU 1673]MDF2178305.1 UDP-2,4-diacetamido-2,4,6-trideoxy-beta-L-altropyranose hydrolase [Aliiglaciecola sp. CAU 1673]
MQVLIRTDSSSAIGGGHVSRCLSLANAMRSAGVNVSFICADLSGNLIGKIASAGFVVHPLAAGLSEAEDSRICQHIFEQQATPEQAIDLLIVDHYQLGLNWQKSVSSLVQRLMVLDDVPQRRICADILLNQNAGIERHQYADFLEKSPTLLLLGTEYALLRSDFSDVPAPELQSVSHCLIQMSATDPDNTTLKVVKTLMNSEVKIEFTIVLSSSAPGLASVRDAIASDKRFTLKVDVENMATLMRHHQVAIGAGGVAALERCAAGLPSLVTVIADNQRPGVQALKEAGAIDEFSLNDESDDALIPSLTAILGDRPAREAMQNAGRLLVDGKGVQKVLKQALQSSPRRYLVRAQDKPIHRDTLLQWQQAPEIRQFARNAQPPTAAEHQAWYSNVLADPNRYLYFICQQGLLLGMVRLDCQAGDEGGEISILTAPGYQGQGVASDGLRMIRQTLPGFRFDAFIKKENLASLRLFLSNGYIAKGDGWYVSTPEK